MPGEAPNSNLAEPEPKAVALRLGGAAAFHRRTVRTMSTARPRDTTPASSPHLTNGNRRHFFIRFRAWTSAERTNADVTSGPPTRMRVGVFILFHS